MSADEFVLRRKRNFGETLNATFVFVRIHARILFRALVQLVLPVLAVIVGLIVILFQNYLIGVESRGGNEMQSFITIAASILLSMILFAGAFALASAVYYAVFRLALEKGNDFDLADVRAIVRKTIWKLIAMYLLQMIFYYLISSIVTIPTMFFMSTGRFEIQAIGFLFNIGIQVVYLSYVACSYAVLVVEQKTVFQSMQRSVKLVQGYFWQTLGLIVTVTIIVYLMMAAPIAHPALIATLLYKLFNAEAFTEWLQDSKLVLTLIGSVYALFVGMSFFFVWMFPTTALALHYISLVEKKEGFGLAIRLNNLLAPAPPADGQNPHLMQTHNAAENTVPDLSVQQSEGLAASEAERNGASEE